MMPGRIALSVTDARDLAEGALRGIGLRIAETAGYAVAITFMLSYLKSEKLADGVASLLPLHPDRPAGPHLAEQGHHEGTRRRSRRACGGR